MKINLHSSVLFVRDIEISKHFYCEILKQEIVSDFGNNILLKNGLSIWQVPEWHILNGEFYTKNNKNNALEIYFETENIEEVVNYIESEKISKYHDMITESWGQRTIRIYDPDSNLIEIGEKLEIFILRMYLEGLSVSQLNKKTGVPIDLINNIIQK